MHTSTGRWSWPGFLLLAIPAARTVHWISKRDEPAWRGRSVYSIEIVEPLALSAERRLRELGYANVHVS